jgi:aminoglycoside 6'-N-acetyltransferase I
MPAFQPQDCDSSPPALRASARNNGVITVRVLQPDEAHVLEHVADDVFDDPIDPRWCAEFFADPRHHLVVALDGDLVVGMTSGVHYVHPDKGPELWINEVGVASTHRGQGLGRRAERDVHLPDARRSQ